jgi:small subunit ribosomal protein S20
MSVSVADLTPVMVEDLTLVMVVGGFLAHSKSALKRWRQNVAHRERNKPVRTAARTAVKDARAAIAAGDADVAKAAVMTAISTVDRATKGNVVHSNAASRTKSRLMRHLNAVGTVAAEEPKKPKARKATKTTKTAAKPAAKTSTARKAAAK